MKYFIYAIINRTTREPFYIGNTVNVQQRIADHRKRMPVEHEKGHYPVYRHIREIGLTNWDIVVLREIDVLSKTEARAEEQIEIDKYPIEHLMNDKRAFVSKDTLDAEKRAYNVTYNKSHRPKINTTRQNYMKELKKDPVKWEHHLQQQRIRSAKYYASGKRKINETK